MKLRKWVSLLLVVIVLCICSGVTMQTYATAQEGQEEQYTIDVPYEYPIKPGTPQWESIISRMERAALCQIPEEVLSEMTTEALARTVLEYPFMVDMYAWRTFSQGYQILKSEFNGLQELEMRPDGLEVLQRLQQEGADDENLLKSRYLDVMISEMAKNDAE